MQTKREKIRRPALSRRRVSPMVAPLYFWTVVFTLLPLGYVLFMSFMQRGERWGFELSFSLESYRQLGNPLYLQILGNSLLVAALTTALTFVIGFPFAYFVSLMPEKRRSLVLLLLVAPFWTNSLVRIYGLTFLMGAQGVLNSILQGVGLTKSPLYMLYNYGAVMVGMVYALLPFMILGIYNSVEKLDWTVVEASRDLGASRTRAFLTTILPLSMPGVMAGCVLVFVPSIGLYFINDIMGGGKTMLVGNLIKDQMTTARNWPLGAALSMVMLLLSLFFLTIYRRMSGGSNLEGLL